MKTLQVPFDSIAAIVGCILCLHCSNPNRSARSGGDGANAQSSNPQSKNFSDDQEANATQSLCIPPSVITGTNLIVNNYEYCRPNDLGEGVSGYLTEALYRIVTTINGPVMRVRAPENSVIAGEGSLVERVNIIFVQASSSSVLAAMKSSSAHTISTTVLGLVHPLADGSFVVDVPFKSETDMLLIRIGGSLLDNKAVFDSEGSTKWKLAFNDLIPGHGFRPAIWVKGDGNLGGDTTGGGGGGSSGGGVRCATGLTAFNGFCWILGPAGMDCVTVCATANCGSGSETTPCGANISAMEDVAIQPGRICADVAAALGVGGSVTMVDHSLGDACTLNDGNSSFAAGLLIHWWSGVATNASMPNLRRICGCDSLP